MPEYTNLVEIAQKALARRGTAESLNGSRIAASVPKRVGMRRAEFGGGYLQLHYSMMGVFNRNIKLQMIWLLLPPFLHRGLAESCWDTLLTAIHFTILSCIARYILCIPGAPLFKPTTSDARSSMATSTALSTAVMKELLNAGFGDSLDYLEGVTIH
ncbi:hypothetical protein B0H17DRAFT_1145396 [Mycena rosella]|uniref:Uncharacterized protein n=1 Tax=Mycena rosella TaxID=1033263 RepID=A0AAD7CQW0_MYCRO|nr:hypothetical protein B0H17DRAFT_1145396 [Mycena rosella]